MASPSRREYAGPPRRFSTSRTGRSTSVLALPVCLLTLLLTACVSPSREGLPPGSPFTDYAELERPSLPDGTALGDVTSHSAELWLKTDGSKQVEVEWASVDAWKTISATASVQSAAARTPIVVTLPDTDFTLTVPLEHLAPGTKYRYYIWVSDPDPALQASRRRVAAQGEFTTLPDPSRSVPIAFAWSGDLGGQDHCRQGEAGYPIFDTIRDQKPDFFIFLGDTIYADNACVSPPNEPGSNFIATVLAEYRAKHHYQRQAAGLRRLLEAVPVYAIWDDHDFGWNDSGANYAL